MPSNVERGPAMEENVWPAFDMFAELASYGGQRMASPSDMLFQPGCWRLMDVKFTVQNHVAKNPFLACGRIPCSLWFC